MAVETKMGMCIVVILVCAFGFLVYHKFDLRQRALLQASLQGKQSDQATQVTDPAGAQTAPQPGGVALQSPRSAGDIVDSGSFAPAANGFSNEASRNPLAATETRPAFDLTEPDESDLDTIRRSDGAPSQSPATDPFAALAARNAARLAQEEEAASTSRDDPFASIPTPAAERRRLFTNAPLPPGPASSNVPEATGAPEFPVFGDNGNGAQSPASETEPDSLAQTASLAPVNVVSNAEPDEAVTTPAFADTESATFDSSETSQAALLTSTPQARPLPPAFPDFSSSIDTADASQSRDLPPVSSSDAPSFDEGTARPLRPVDDSSRQLIAMLEPQPDVDPFVHDRPVTKPSAALFNIADEHTAAPENSPATAAEFNSNATIRPFDPTRDGTTDAVDATKGDAANPFGTSDAWSEQKTGSQSLSSRNDTVAPATGQLEVGVARFHNPRQIQQVAGTSEPCEICEVRLDDNYWTISKRTYGTARYFSSLALYNQHRVSDPKKLRPGMKVLIPDSSVLEERYPEFFRDQQRTAAQPTGYFLKPDGTPAYRVGDSETLSEISQKHLGRASRWIQIYRLNQQILKDPNRLKLGTVIVLPDDATDVHLAP
mgnify:CR=1 FL=1